MKRWALAFLFYCGISQATTFSTDWSDLWYNPSESGWGVNVIQQQEVLFATLFVYGSSGQPIWYVAPATTYAGGTSFSGPLYQTAGPWFGGSFDPVAVSARQVGTITFSFSALAEGTVVYSVDGVTVSKTIIRQTWRNNDLTGDYAGGLVGTYSGTCPVAGYAEEPADFSVSQTGGNITVVAQFLNRQCVITGGVGSLGRLSAISGNSACSDGSGGSVAFTEIEAGVISLSGRGTITSGNCRWTGNFGGLRRHP